MDERMSYLHQRDPSVDRRFRPRPRNQFNLINAISEDDTESNMVESESSSSGSSSTMITDSNAAVYLRLRPTTARHDMYKVNKNVLIVQNADGKDAKENREMAEKHFTFTNIFSDEANQAEIYNNCVYPFIQEGENLTVLTYGTSGSGKTYTMHGTDRECGIISRAIEQIFTTYGGMVTKMPGIKMDRGNMVFIDESNYQHEVGLRRKFIDSYSNDDFGPKRQRIHDDHSNFTDNSIDNCNGEVKQFVCVWVSFAEIYNEQVFDLLDIDKPKQSTQKKKRENLKVICNEGEAFIKDLTAVHVRNADDAFAVLNVGINQVQTAFTNVNDRSSRSHCVFMIDILSYNGDGFIDHIKYKFCDLAGSERLKKTQNEGVRLREAQGIHASLSVLGRCLETTYRNQKLNTSRTREVVPFRESKLTTLLQAPLQGREKIITIVNMCPTKAFLEENLYVLGFAAMAQQVVQVVSKPKRRSSLVRRNRSTRFSWIMNENTNMHNRSAEANFLVELNME